MSKCLGLIVIVTAIISSFAQNSSSDYQPATVMGVSAHQNAPGEPDVARYDVTLKAANNVYVVLYTPPQGQRGVEYAAGMDLLVLVQNDSIRFSKFGTTADVPIVSHEALPIQKTIDWSKAPGQYFTMKMQNLTQHLSLTDDQQAKIKPIAEQEAGELGYLWRNPVMSDKDKLKQLEKVVQSNDAKIKPILSAEQQTKLEQMREEQKHELEALVAARKEAKNKE